MVTQNDPSREAKGRLTEFADACSPTEPSAAVESRVMQAWDTRAHRRAHAAWRVSPRWVLAGCGAVGLALGLWLPSPAPHVVAPRTAAIPMPVDRVDARLATLAYLGDDPRSLQVVRLRATPDALTRLGLALPGVPDGVPVAIEVVLGPDGAARSARVLGDIEEH